MVYYQREVEGAFSRVGITGPAAAVLMIVFGLLILVFPYLVAILIGVGLLLMGLLSLLSYFEGRPRSLTNPPPSTPPPYTPPP